MEPWSSATLANFPANTVTSWVNQLEALVNMLRRLLTNPDRARQRALLLKQENQNPFLITKIAWPRSRPSFTVSGLFENINVIRPIDTSFSIVELTHHISVFKENGVHNAPRSKIYRSKLIVKPWSSNPPDLVWADKLPSVLNFQWFCNFSKMTSMLFIGRLAAWIKVLLVIPYPLRLQRVLLMPYSMLCPPMICKAVLVASRPHSRRSNP